MSASSTRSLAGEGRITVVNETKPALKDNEYALSTELPDGAKVVFVNRSVSKAMSAANSEGSAYNRAGVDVTPVDGILTTDNDEIVWTVEKTEGGFFLKRTDGKKLSIGNKPDGGTYNSMGFDQEDNPVWKIAPAATDGCIYLQSATATGSSGDPKSVEWYAQYSNFSMYYVNSSNEALFAMDMYVNTGAGKPAPAATTEKLVPSTLREGAEIPAYITTPKGYKADGSFPFVVMIHGHGGNHNESDGFDKISNGLAEQGFVVATLDLPGCGKSKESFQLNTMTNMKAGRSGRHRLRLQELRRRQDPHRCVRLLHGRPHHARAARRGQVQLLHHRARRSGGGSYGPEEPVRRRREVGHHEGRGQRKGLC